MRINIVQGPFLPVPPLRGGAVEKIWSELGREFARRGHVVTHLSRAFPGLPECESVDGVTHLRLGGADTPRAWRPVGGVDLAWPIRLLRDWAYCRGVQGRLPTGDVVVSNTFFLPMLLPRQGAAGALYVHCQRFPQVHYRGYRHAARLQAVSTAVAKRIREIVPGSEKRISLIPNPLPDGFGLTGELEFTGAANQRQPLILFVGRIHPQKGVSLLIDALSRLHSQGHYGWRLRFVGPTDAPRGGGGADFEAALHRQAERLGTSVEWAGFESDPRELERHYRAASIFVYPSIDSEGEASPVAPVEAMANGCAVVVSDLACFEDYLRHGREGLRFNPFGTGGSDRLAQQLAKLIESPSQRAALSKEGWLRARELRMSMIVPRFLEDFNAARS